MLKFGESCKDSSLGTRLRISNSPGVPAGMGQWLELVDCGLLIGGLKLPLREMPIELQRGKNMALFLWRLCLCNLSWHPGQQCCFGRNGRQGWRTDRWLV